jgi:hypothetical protein
MTYDKPFIKNNIKANRNEIQKKKIFSLGFLKENSSMNKRDK